MMGAKPPLCVDLGGDRYHLHVQDGFVLVAGGVLARAVPVDGLLGLVLELGAAAVDLLEYSTGEGRPGSDPDVPAPLPASEPRSTAPCPRCGVVSEGAYSAQSCSACGHAWRDAPDDDVDVGPGRAGGGR